MGFALAEECAQRGAEVWLIAGPTSLSITHPLIKRIDVESAQQMHMAATDVFPQMDAAILSAAVADYRPQEFKTEKLKREGKEDFSLNLTINPDIAASLGQMKGAEQTLIGFALETNDEMQNAKKKLEKKNLDFIVINSLQEKGAGFGGDTNKVTILMRNGDHVSFGLKSKKEVAKDIIDFVFHIKSSKEN